MQPLLVHSHARLSPMEPKSSITLTEKPPISTCDIALSYSMNFSQGHEIIISATFSHILKGCCSTLLPLKALCAKVSNPISPSLSSQAPYPRPPDHLGSYVSDLNKLAQNCTLLQARTNVKGRKTNLFPSTLSLFRQPSMLSACRAAREHRCLRLAAKHRGHQAQDCIYPHRHQNYTSTFG